MTERFARRQRSYTVWMSTIESAQLLSIVEVDQPDRVQCQHPGCGAYFRLKDGTGWVRVQRHDGHQMLVPLPAFEGWDEALPTAVGTADQDHQAYLVPDIARAIAFLRQRASSELVSGVWAEIQARSKVP